MIRRGILYREMSMLSLFGFVLFVVWVVFMVAAAVRHALRWALALALFSIYPALAHADTDLVTPAALYSLGGAADWSASRYALRARPSLHESNRLGLTGGVLATSALFMGADVVLQRKGHRGAARMLRVVYAVGVGALVTNSLLKTRGR